VARSWADHIIRTTPNALPFIVQAQVAHRWDERLATEELVNTVRMGPFPRYGQHFEAGSIQGKSGWVRHSTPMIVGRQTTFSSGGSSPMRPSSLGDRRRIDGSGTDPAEASGESRRIPSVS